MVEMTPGMLLKRAGVSRKDFAARLEQKCGRKMTVNSLGVHLRRTAPTWHEVWNDLRETLKEYGIVYEKGAWWKR